MPRTLFSDETVRFSAPSSPMTSFAGSTLPPTPSFSASAPAPLLVMAMPAAMPAPETTAEPACLTPAPSLSPAVGAPASCLPALVRMLGSRSAWAGVKKRSMMLAANSSITFRMDLRSLIILNMNHRLKTRLRTRNTSDMAKAALLSWKLFVTSPMPLKTLL